MPAANFVERVFKLKVFLVKGLNNNYRRRREGGDTASCFARNSWIKGFRTRAIGPGAETFMHPKILFGHFAHTRFKKFVHAARIRDVILGWEIFPSRINLDDIAFAVGPPPRDRGNNYRTRKSR